MSIEQIQNLSINVVKAHLEGDYHKNHLYKTPYTKRINALCMPHGFQPLKSQQFDGKANPKQLYDLFKALHSICIQTLFLDPLIVGGKWKVSSSITYIACVA